MREKALERENRDLKEKLAELYLENGQLKNSGTGYASRRSVKCLRDHRTEFGSVAQGVQIMKLASSSYYYQPLTDRQSQAQSDALLRDRIEQLQQDFPRLRLSEPGSAAQLLA